MKILAVHETKEQKKNPDWMDLLAVDVQYLDDVVQRNYMYRASYEMYVMKNELINKYNIPEKEMEKFLDKVIESQRAQNFYD